jgi:acyl-CoA thioesterase I
MRVRVFVFIFSLISFFLRAETAKFIDYLEKGESQIIVIYGTSISCGPWVRMLDEFLDHHYPGLAHIINSSKSGMQSNEAIKSLDEHVIQKNPDVVFIEFAINDPVIDRQTTVHQSRINIETVINRISEHNPNCEIILMTTNPPVREHLRDRPNVYEYFQIYKDVASEKNLLLIDLFDHWKKILDNDPELFDEYVPDGIHPNWMGCENIIIPNILEALYFPSFKKQNRS